MNRPTLEEIKQILLNEWWRRVDEKIEDSPEGHCEGMAKVLMERLES